MTDNHVPLNSYFQKSTTFLLPLIGLRLPMQFVPANTYISWEGKYLPKDYKLIVTYHNLPEDRAWQEFHYNVLTRCSSFENHYNSADLKLSIYVFDLSEFEEDFDNFLQGKYSQFSDRSYNIINRYCGYSSAEWVSMEPYLRPDRFVGGFADFFDIDEEGERALGQRCCKPDLEKENLDVETDKIQEMLLALPLNRTSENTPMQSQAEKQRDLKQFVKAVRAMKRPES